MATANTSSIEVANTQVASTDNVVEQGQPIMPLLLDMAYKGDEVTSHVARILDLPDVHGWEVVDSKDNLALVHYTDDADMAAYGHLRGILVDLEVEAIIADSFGYTPTAVASQLEIGENGRISIVDEDGTNHSFNPEEAIIKRVFEGVVIRAIWHKSQFYRITHRKINPVRSHWGTPKSFLALYDEANGPTAEQLFDTSKPYSSTCYDFLVSAEPLVVGTRQKITHPYIICLAQRTMDVKRPLDEVAPGRALFTTTDVISGSVTEPMIHDPKRLTIEEANHHLKFGYYNEFLVEDERQLTGEAVIVYRMTNGIVSDIVKVHSPAYEWRVNMRGNNPNITHQFYCLLNSVYNDIKTVEDWEAFKKRLIVLPLYDEMALKELYAQNKAILMIPLGEVAKEDYTSRDSRIHLLWMNYVLSLPPSAQGDALNILAKFKKDRNEVIEWLQTLEAKTPNIEAAEVPERVKGLISSCRRLARQRIANGDNYSANGTFMRLPLLIKSTLRNLVNKENGPSLFGLIREMRNIKGETVVHPKQT